MPSKPLSLFGGYGIELEYMIVDRESGAVRPVADGILAHEAGETCNSVERGAIAWSNELVLHVIELKTNGPASALQPLPALFHNEIQYINDYLLTLDACLMPTAMHPLMVPARDSRLWPHDDSEIYAAYNRIFDCRGHGWSNLQSMHINLPFNGDREFHRLHTAIRTLLPIMPAIAASSPLLEGEPTGFMDTRLETYRSNSRRIPAVTGLVIPETVKNRREYEQIILEPMYAAIAPYDPAGTLQHEWLNSRGAIARFDRNAIEIRVLDTQESATADIVVADAIVSVLKALLDEQWSSIPEQEQLTTEELAALLLDIVRDADQTVIRSREYLKLFRFPGRQCSASELWQYLAESLDDDDASELRAGFDFILNNGCLARRVVRAVGPSARRSYVEEVCRALSRCLQRGEFFEGI